MVEFNLTPQQENPIQILAKMMKILESKLDITRATVDMVYEQANMNLAASSITGRTKEQVRDEVVAYIRSLDKFDAKVFYGGYNTRLRLVDYAVDLAKLGPDDIALEFGVFRGESLSVISRKSPGKVYGFDSFEGLPASELIWKKGQFNNPDGVVFPIGKNTELVKGWFSDTMPDFVKNHDLSKVKFLHMDCDIYTSAVEIFETIFPHLGPDVIVLFDEYWNYEGWKDGEFKAFHEYLKKSGRTYDYLAYMDAGNSVAIRLH